MHPILIVLSTSTIRILGQGRTITTPVDYEGIPKAKIHAKRQFKASFADAGAGAGAPGGAGAFSKLSPAMLRRGPKGSLRLQSQGRGANRG